MNISPNNRPPSDHDNNSNNSTNSSDTITRITLGEREIILVGTAHISHESVEEITQVIQEEKPDHVCVEIDKSRYETLIKGQKWETLKIDQVLKQRKGFLLLANLVLSAFQRRMGKEFNIIPGQEMKAAIEAARQNNIPFSFCDREVHITLRRAWAKSSFWNKNKLLAVLMASFFSREEFTKEEIEKLKQKNALQDMMEELSHYLPSIKEVLIDERDRYLATRIFTAPGEKIVAAIGAGHTQGIIAYLQMLQTEEIDTNLTSLDQIPPPSLLTKTIPYLIPLIVLALIGYGFLQSGWDRGIEMFIYWFSVNGILAGIGAIIALAHPITILLTIVAAPFTSLNPTIGVGIVSGLCEAFFRRPRVKDFESLYEDMLSIRGFYKNRFIHALVVFLFCSLGSSIGTFIAFPFLISLLSG